MAQYSKTRFAGGKADDLFAQAIGDNALTNKSCRHLGLLHIEKRTNQRVYSMNALNTENTIFFYITT